MIVLKALSLNKGTLLLLAIFIFETVYIFSIISYLFFGDQYVPDSSYCNSLIQCMATNLYYGVSSGGQLVQFVDAAVWNRGAYTIFWILFNLFFYIVTVVILLNVILSVIVDTFGELRDKRVETEYHKANFCFICSIEREIFQRKGIDFSKHVEDDHNKWHYLYFFAHLKERKSKKQENQLTKQEEYVYRLISSRNSLHFFPLEKAMCLTTEEEEEALNAKMYQKVCEMEGKLQTNNNKVQQLTVLLASALEQIRTLKTQQPKPPIQKSFSNVDLSKLATTLKSPGNLMTSNLKNSFASRENSPRG